VKKLTTEERIRIKDKLASAVWWRTDGVGGDGAATDYTHGNALPIEASVNEFGSRRCSRCNLLRDPPTES